MGYYGCLPTRYKKNWVTFASNFYFRSQAVKYGLIIKIGQSYTLLSSVVEVDLSDLTITICRNDKTYPKTEK